MKHSQRPAFSPSASGRNNRFFPNKKDSVSDSSGPGGKIRGTPQQIAEKYTNMGRDALSSGDPVMAESFFQHAEHYKRLISVRKEEAPEKEDGEQSQESFDSPRGGQERAFPVSSQETGNSDPETPSDTENSLSNPELGSSAPSHRSPVRRSSGPRIHGGQAPRPSYGVESVRVYRRRPTTSTPSQDSGSDT